MRTKTKAGDNARKMFDLKMKQFEKLKEIKKNQKLIRRKKMMGGGLAEATQRLRRQGLKEGGKVARGCGAIMSNRSKKTKTF